LDFVIEEDFLTIPPFPYDEEANIYLKTTLTATGKKKGLKSKKKMKVKKVLKKTKSGKLITSDTSFYI